MKNVKELLAQATALPAAIEAKLPEGAPKVSTMLLDAANKIPAVPDFPVEIPDLPAPPELPELPELPGGLGRPLVTNVEVRGIPTTTRIPNATLHRGPPLVQAYTQPIEGVLGQVVTRRGM